MTELDEMARQLAVPPCPDWCRRIEDDPNDSEHRYVYDGCGPEDDGSGITTRHSVSTSLSVRSSVSRMVWSRSCPPTIDIDEVELTEPRQQRGMCHMAIAGYPIGPERVETRT